MRNTVHVYKLVELLVNAKSGYRLNTQGVGKKPGSKGSSYKYLNTGGNSNARPSISRTRVGSKQKPIMNTYKLNDYIVFAKGKIK